jgi:hypothetical protein
LFVPATATTVSKITFEGQEAHAQVYEVWTLASPAWRGLPIFKKKQLETLHMHNSRESSEHQSHLQFGNNCFTRICNAQFSNFASQYIKSMKAL